MGESRSIRLREKSQTQKAMYYVIPFTWYSGKAKGKRTETLSARGWRWGERIDYKEGIFYNDRNIPYLDYGGGYTTVLVI